jgi:E3 ubiquitin-protein ligase ZNF598
MYPAICCSWCGCAHLQITLSDDRNVQHDPSTRFKLGIKEYNVKCVNQKAFDAATELLSFSCQRCQETGENVRFKSEDELTRHVVRTHQLFFCDVCTENQKLFLHEHTLYTRKDLVAHKRSKTSVGTETHPKCQFCDTRFFDMDALMMHLTRVSSLHTC